MRLVACILLACSLSAGEAVLPIVSVTVPDLPRSAQRLSAGPYGAIWRLPAVQQLRDELGTLPDADPVWLGLIDRLLEARLELTLRPYAQGSDPLPRLALRLPPGQDPRVPDGAEAKRIGDWWLLGDKGDALAVPAPTAGPATADLRIAVDLPAIAGSLPPESTAPYLAVLGALGLSRIEAEATAVPEGVREQMRAIGARLPLRAIDPAALAGFPAKPVGIAAVGIDGKALVRTVHAIATAVGGEAELARGDAPLRQIVGMGLDEVLESFDGTTVFATTPGVPIPGMVLSLPASAKSDQLVAGLLAMLTRQDGAQLVADARTQLVAVPLPPGTPVMLSLRRTATRWILGTDQIVLMDLAGDKPAPFPLAETWPKSAGAAGLAWGDTRAQVQMIAGFLPMALAQVREADMRRRIGLVQQALFAALPHLRPSSMVAMVDAQGLRIDGENGIITDIMPLSIGAGMALPAIAMVRESARKANAGSNMRQITLAMIVYGSENDGLWPKDLAETKTWADGELTDKIFQSPGHPEITKPFLYVRPDPKAKAIQPVLVQDPACNRGKGSVVSYADGHIGFVKGTGLWTEAKRLAALPKATVKEQGIEMADWTVNTETGLPMVGDGPRKLWFYDLNTGELFAGDVAELPPITAPSGDLKNSKGTPAGVLASVIRIEGDKNKKIAFLQAYTPDAKKMIEASRQSQGGTPADYEKIMAGTMVALPPAKPGDPIKWVAMSSPDGYKITMAMETIAGGKPYNADLP